ncbi:SAV_2336 N-terminal domain-related protein [Bradyrhizobium nitroreducens]|nr:SAV_2336 N-terminal domain-related protein [Bradyrhizobium nitroreducens]
MTDQKLNKFITILREADFDVSWDNVLDALWLASLGRKLDLGGAPSTSRPAVNPTSDGTDPQNEHYFDRKNENDRKARENDEQEEPGPNSKKTGGGEADAHTGLYARGDIAPGDRTVTASSILLPAARTLPDRLAVTRALKPFRRRRPSDIGVELDEARTAELTAELRLVLDEGLFAVLRPQQERWYEAHVVLEDEPAVEVWGAPLREFVDLLRQTGAFRLVRVWRLRLDHANPRDPQKARLETPAGALISPRVLAGDERRLVFFASHGDSLHWVDGIYPSLLKSWSAASLVLLHLLPRHRWTYTLLGEPQALARASRPGSAAEALDIETLWWRVSPDPSQPRVLRLPVVPILPQALGIWSRMQMGLGQGTEAFLIDPAETLTDAELAGLLPERIEPARALTNLRERSVAAFDLAVMLASAPFTLPVARLVQEVTQEGRTDFSVLAELMLSGVVVTRGSEEADERTSETTYFEISAAVRPHLLRSLRKSDATALAVALDRRLSAYLSSIAGRSVQFSALLADERGSTKLPAWARAFAHLTTALRGGREPLPDWNFQDARKALEELSRPVLGQIARLAANNVSFSANNVQADLWPFIKDPRFVAATPGGLKFRPEVAAYLADQLKDRAFLGLRVLWVDDYPANNTSPAATLTQGGAEPIQYALTTEQALQHPALRQFDVILSDMTRDDNHSAGYELLSQLRVIGLKTPVIIFAASSMNTAKRRARAVAAGAFGGTNRVDVLLELIEQAARSAMFLREEAGDQANASTPGLRPTPDDDAQAIETSASPQSAPSEQSPAWRDVAILWVDDRPDNNIRERAFLTLNGAFVTLALSTEDALQALTEHRFDAIISDLGRPEGNRAGFDLLRRVRERSTIPFAIYAGARGVQLADEATRLGATISTNRFEQIAEALRGALDGSAWHTMLSEVQSARLRELLKRYDTSTWPDQSQVLSAAYQWSSVWQTMESSDLIATLAVAIVNAVTNTDYCQLFSVTNDRIILAASRIESGKVGYSEASWEGVIGRAVRTGTIVHLPDVTADHEYIPAEASTRSELAIPIIGRHGKAIGVFNIESTRLSAFSGHQSQWLMTFAATLIDYFSQQQASGSALGPKRPTKSDQQPSNDNDLNEGRGEIARLVAEELDLDTLFERLMAVTKRFIDFDEADARIIASDGEHSRTICVFGTLARPTARWLRMNADLISWTQHPDTWVSDLRDVPSTASDMFDATDVRAGALVGYRSLISQPVHQRGTIRGWISLLSKTPEAYGGETLRTFRQLGLDEAFAAIFYAADRAENLFVANLLKKMEANNLSDAAQAAVTDIRNFYSFETVSIFSVNQPRGLFVLLAEATFGSARRDRPGYTQRFDAGLLGLAYQRGEPVVVNNFDDGSDEARSYVRVNPDIQSALCIPIRQFGRIIWILSVEDRLRDAFIAIDVETFRRIVQRMEIALERRQRIPDEPKRREYSISGRVQGVGFRAFVQQQFSALALEGTVETLRDGRVRVVATGLDVQLDQLESRLRQGPPASKVDDVVVQSHDVAGEPGSSSTTATLQRPAIPRSDRRAVIAIGVDKVARLPSLRAATSAARQFAQWSSESQGIHQVWLFTDGNRPVGISEIREAIKTCVLRGDLDQIIVYFSGHGTSIAQQDLWLLSDASQDLNEAIGVDQNVQLARSSGIPHVVFISDTSRAPLDMKALLSAMGSPIFPNLPAHPSTSVRSEIDRFFAAGVAQNAYEIDGESVFTSVLLSALSGSEPSVLTQHDGRQIISSRSLSRFLRQAVPKKLEQFAVSLHQAPDSIIESGGDSWLAMF